MISRLSIRNSVIEFQRRPARDDIQYEKVLFEYKNTTEFVLKINSRFQCPCTITCETLQVFIFFSIRK